MSYLSDEKTAAVVAHAPGLLKALGTSMESQHIADLRRSLRACGTAMGNIAGAADTAKRKMSDSESLAFETISAVANDISLEIEKRENRPNFGGSNTPEGGTTSSTSGTKWVDSRGREVRVLAPDDKLSASKDDAPSVGDLMLAMALGDRGVPEIRAALSEGNDTAGGYTVPDHLMGEFIDLMRAKTRVVQAGARTVMLETDRTSIARLAADPSPGWRGENGAVAESDPTFELVSFNARSLAVLIKVSRELLEDSVNVTEMLMSSLAGAFAVEADKACLVGGDNTVVGPTGLINTPGVLSVDMGTDGAALSGYSKLIEALQSLADVNAPDPTAWLMAPRTKYALAGLTDTTGQPLRAPGVVEKIPQLDTTSIPVDDAHGSATNASRIITGDFSQLMIGMRSTLRIEVLKETFAENLQYGFLAHLRMDSALAHPQSFCQVEGIIPA